MLVRAVKRTEWLVILLTAGTVCAASLDVGSRRQLFIDDRFVQAARSIDFRVHAPRKTGDVTLTADPPHELGQYNTVLEHNGVYHLWYSAGPGVCYARSRDGIHWDKPSLNLTSGSLPAPNNVVLGSGAGGLKGGPHGLMVFIDPTAPDSERFRLVANPEQFDSFLQIFSSPDGIHWKHSNRDILKFDNTKKPFHLDSQNTVFWDDRLRKYVVYFRKNLRQRNSQARSIARAESTTLSFGHVQDWPAVFTAHERTPGHYDPVRKSQVAVLDVYTNGVTKYPWAEDVYFMFPTLYYHYGAFQNEFREQVPVNAGVIDVRFGASRDGIGWNTYDFRPFVPLGMQGDFDARRIYMVYGIVPALNGREMYMYYMGTNEAHGWGRDDKNNRLLTAAGLGGEPERRAISRVTLRRDGFVSVSAGSGGGEFTTPAMKFGGNQLVLNVDTSAAGEVQVEVQDEEGKPIPGFTLQDADLIHSANAIDRPVTWNRQSAIDKLQGKTVRLHFVIRDADLYAFQFRERPSL